MQSLASFSSCWSFHWNLEVCIKKICIWESVPQPLPNCFNALLQELCHLISTKICSKTTYQSFLNGNAKMGHPHPSFCFSFFSIKFYWKNFSEIWTRIVIVEGEHPDHVTHHHCPPKEVSSSYLATKSGSIYLGMIRASRLGNKFEKLFSVHFLAAFFRHSFQFRLSRVSFRETKSKQNPLSSDLKHFLNACVDLV